MQPILSVKCIERYAFMESKRALLPVLLCEYSTREAGGHPDRAGREGEIECGGHHLQKDGSLKRGERQC
jgi:hypothetical protein